MKKYLFVLFSLILTGFAGQSQPFTNISAGLPNLGYSYAAWGDYDHDGDLDLLLSGMQGSAVSVTKIFRNDNGVFTDINANLPGLMASSAEWGDYDKDGDLDLLLTGNTDAAVPTTKIFRNDNGVFIDINANLPGVSDGKASWGDYDNDGDLDILLAGSMICRIYRNYGNGQFTDPGFHLKDIMKASACWCDFNNDGWMDALICGETGSGPSTILYRNDHGTFTEDNVGFTGLSDGQAKWADLNNDGRADLVIGGIDKYGLGQFLIYQNNGNEQFTEISTYTMNAASVSMDIGDYDNDGYLDVVVIGKIQGCGPTALTMLYHNEGFMILTNVSTLITGMKYGNAAFGDYNNDGYSDLVFTGLDAYEAPVSAIYVNNSGTAGFATNSPPSVPSGLSSGVDAQKVSLSWNSATDQQTNSYGLSYNLFIGTSPVLGDIVSPMSNLSGGYRLIPAIGNTNADTMITIRDLPAGTYYWSVQSIDNGFEASAFSPVQSFAITSTGTQNEREQKTLLSPNPVQSAFMVTGKDISGSDYRISDLSGKVVQNGILSSGNVDVSSLQSGTYFLEIIGTGKVQILRFSKE